MKFLALALIVLLSVSNVAATIDITTQCKDAGQACPSQSMDCLAGLMEIATCISDNNCNQDDLSSFLKCMSPCKTSNAEAQGFVDSVVKCLSSQYLAFTSVLAMLLFLLF